MISTEPAPAAPESHPADVAERLVPAKIRPDHLQRLAVVYVRQSSPQQVRAHPESTALQYDLRHRAIDWGWPSQRVLVVDQDQGQSAASAEGRVGFQHVLAEVALDHVGLILGIEMSRLARSCKDWHQLLELCAVFGTLLADQDGLYDPREYNDRLLLGIKGTLSEAELHLIQQRMHQGRLNKARRGALFSHAPIGYVRSATGTLALDPDEQAQAVVRLIFDRFDELGSISAVLRYLVRHSIQMPVRPHSGPNRGTLQWHRPNRQTLATLLHHPIYAGAYTWGRRQLDPRRKKPGRRGSGRVVVSPDRWTVLLKDHCPAYVTWERYQVNQRRIAANRARRDRPGAIREGPALLTGLLACGRCGCRMRVQYDRPHVGSASRRNRTRYVCSQHASNYGRPVCQSISGAVLEALVSRQILAVLEPAALELSLVAAEDIERQRAAIDRHWRQRLERADYETDRARRQYDEVEPENRLVARELERQWEQRLLEQRSLKDQDDRSRHAQPTTLVDADRDLIRSLSADIPELWHSPKTSPAGRQAVVRQLIQRVTVTAPRESQHADVQIHWAGDYASQHRLVRPVAGYEQMDNYQQLMGRILELREKRCTSAQIAEQLNRDGFRPPKHRPRFSHHIVGALLSRHGRDGKRPDSIERCTLPPDEWSLADLARHLQIPQPTLYSWLRRGWVHGRRQPGALGRWILWADAEEVDRLRKLRRCRRSWYNQPQSVDLTRPKARSRPC